MKTSVYLSAVATVVLGSALAAHATDPGSGELPVVTAEATVSETTEPTPYSRVRIQPATFVISRTGSTAGPLDVYFLLGGTATNGDDYGEIPAHIQIPTDASFVRVFIGPLQDNLREGDETVTLQVLTPPCLPVRPPPPHCYITGHPESASVVIHDADPAPQPVVNITATDPVAWEQSADLAIPPDVAVFEVTRRGAVDIPLDVYYSVHGSADNGLDYVDETGQALTGHVVIPVGEASMSILVFPVDDTLAEETESVVVQVEPIICPRIYPPPPWCYVVGSHAVAEAELFDDDDAPVNLPPHVAITLPIPGAIFSVSDSIPIVVEAGDPDGWVQRVEIFANNQKIDEQVILFSGPPPAGQDQVFFFAWEKAPAGAHVLTARASDTQGGSTRSETVPIEVREAPVIPEVNTWATDPFAREEMAPHRPRNLARFRVRRTGPTDQPLVIDYALGGTAANGEDYESIAGHVTIPAGRYSAAIDILPIDDEIPEGMETVTLKPFVAVDVEPPPFRVGRHAVAGAVIVDRDHPLPVCYNLAGGVVYLCRHAQDGEIVDVQATDRLGGPWASIGTITVEDGALYVADPEAADRPRRYYRFVPVSENKIAAED